VKLYYVATPFHMFCALHMISRENNLKEVDMIVLDHFQSAKETCSRLVDIGLINKAVLINKKTKFKHFSYIKRILQSLLLPKSVKDIIDGKQYDEVVFFSNDFLMAAKLIDVFVKTDSCTKYRYGMDGMGSYVRDMVSPNKHVNIILKVFGLRDNLDRINGQYVFRTELVTKDTDLKLLEIGYVNKVEILKLTDKLWGNSNIDYNNFGKYIYIQQPMDEDNEVQSLTYERRLFEIFNDFIGKDDMVIKIHPRSRICNIDGYSHIVDEPMWETTILKLDIDDKVLISLISTAVFMPKILYDSEPVIILLYHLMGETFIDKIERISPFVNRIRDMYRDKGKIIIPKSEEELKAGLLRLNSQI
jgi:hypothetical protein